MAAAAAARALPPFPASKQLTLLLLQQGDRVLLGMKRRGFGVGRWNGFGGKVEPGESLAEGAVRETEEEAGVRVADAALVGNLRFVFRGSPERLEVHVFRATSFSGDVAPSEEMEPRWWPTAAVPFADMWPDDALWLPHVLAGRRVVGTFEFEGTDTIVSHELAVVDAVPVDPASRPVVAAQAPISL